MVEEPRRNLQCVSDGSSVGLPGCLVSWERKIAISSNGFYVRQFLGGGDSSGGKEKLQKLAMDARLQKWRLNTIRVRSFLGK